MLCVEEVPPGGDAGIVAGQGGGQTGPKWLMPVRQDARLRRVIEIVAEPLGFCAVCAAAAYRTAIRVQPDDVPATAVEGEMPAIAVGVRVDPEIPKEVGSGSIGSGTCKSKAVRSRLVFMVSRHWKHLGIEHAPARRIAQSVVVQIVAFILHVTQTQNEVHGGIRFELVARPLLRAAVGRSVAAVEIGVVRVARDVSSRRDNRVAILASDADAYPSGQAGENRQNNNYQPMP